MAALRVRPVGQHALLVEVDDLRSAEAAYRHILRLVEAGSARDAPTDVVPAARTVLIDGIEPDVWRALLGSVDWTAAAEYRHEGRTVTIPVRYDGPDLADVAAAWGCGEDQVIERHRAAEFRVAFCGFAPGFAYCTSDPPLPAVSRRDNPRTSVPKGSVGLAGEYCGVYPRAMPGGWRLIGSTELVLFDIGRDEPALLRPGTRVRFEAAP